MDLAQFRVTFQEYAHSLQAFIEGQGLHKPILLGHSFGGMLAQEHMALYPDVAASAILYGTSPAFGNAQGKRQQDFIRTRLQPLEEGKTIPELAEGMLNNMLGTKGISANAKALALKALAQTSEKTYINSIMCLKTFDQRKNLGAITIPCLLLVGSEDKNTPAAMMETMAGKIANAQFCCFANLGHMVHLEDPEGFNEMVLAFLAGQDS